MRVLERADAQWRGDGTFEGLGSTLDLRLEEVEADVAFIPSFANVAALRTADGLVLVDTGSHFLADNVHDQVRGWCGDMLHTAVFTHGHVDHVFGVDRYQAAAVEAAAPLPQVVAHEAVPRRFARYRLTAGYNGVINARQFGLSEPMWPTHYREPDVVYRDSLQLSVGGVDLSLRHGKGETDDATWVYLPQRRVLLTGDLVIWCTPNAGNPQKAQRFPREWAQALREMDGLGAELLLPGHGLPVVGADRVHQLLSETAALLESLVEQSLVLLNAGARLDTLLQEVKAPADLLERPYLRPIYDEPEFVVHNIWRLYGGWYDGNPAHLKPAPEPALAAEVVALCGGPAVLADRAQLLAGRGDDLSLRLAGHLAEMAVQAAPGDVGIAGLRATVFAARAAAERSLMARGVFGAVAAGRE